MHAIKHLAVGDRLTVIYHERTYHSVVQDMPTPDTLVIAQPTNMGVYLNLMESDQAEVLFIKENGILTFHATQEERFNLDNIPMLRLKAASAVKRSQRRSFYRLEKSLPVQLSVKEETETSGSLTIKARTINISGGGCRIAIRQPMDSDARLECKIILSPNTELVLDGQVVWVEEKREGTDKTNIIGVQFIDEDTSKQKKLVTYVLDEQRKQLNRERP